MNIEELQAEFNKLTPEQATALLNEYKQQVQPEFRDLLKAGQKICGYEITEIDKDDDRMTYRIDGLWWKNSETKKIYTIDQWVRKYQPFLEAYRAYKMTPSTKSTSELKEEIEKCGINNEENPIGLPWEGIE